MMQGLDFLSPGRLLLLVVPALLLLAYGLSAARRRRYSIRLATVDMLDKVAPDRPGWRRHLMALLLVVAVATATVAFARPVVAGEAVESSKLVVLAIDTSISMEATDVSPTRVDAARDAAGVFLESVPDGVAVGVVTFDGSARQLISPTPRLDAVARIVDGSVRLDTLGQGTAIGEAVFTSIDAITATVEASYQGEAPDTAPVGAIVLLSDGDTTMGRSNDEAASAARSQGIPVHTIAFGTDSGTIDDPISGRVAVPVNDAALAKLASETGGRAVTAATAEQLADVYGDLGESVTVEREQVEVSEWFVGAALALLSLAGIGSLVWFGRLP